MITAILNYIVGILFVLIFVLYFLTAKRIKSERFFVSLFIGAVGILQIVSATLLLR